MGKWQCKWNAEYQKGQWTKRLIKDIEPWVKRNHGDLTYRMTQALTGHGCFGTFLKRIRKVSVDTCKYCPETDTPEHTVFQCVRFDVERRTCCFETDSSLTPDNIVGTMHARKPTAMEQNCQVSGKDNASEGSRRKNKSDKYTIKL
uniref:Reverse transcriptase zinc-binding domain-containing protein n=2 Tax=Cacopsylla melanoneura TaxID=428564 RepID=A0A8D8R397_9HEMI